MFDQRLNQLSAQIAKMTPQQRQQFAMMHKNDPILVSLTKFVNDQDRATRNALQAEKLPEAVNQPKVVDQTIAQMANPENFSGPMITEPPRAQPGPGAGLPALEAPNLASMPNGGIAGQPEEAPSYAEGGKVNLYGVEEPRNPFAFLNPGDIMDSVKRWRESGKPLLEYLGVSSVRKPETASVEQFKDMPTERDVVNAGMMAPEPAGPLPSLQPKPPVPAEDPHQKQQALYRSLLMRELGYNDKGEPVGGTGSGGTGARRGPAGGGIAALAAPAGAQLPELPPEMDVRGEYTKTMGSLPAIPPEIEARLNKVAEARLGLAGERSAETQKMYDELGIAGVEREKRLKAKEEKIGTEEKANFNMALLTAGLAMLAQDSPNGLANIGKGAMVGVEQYERGKARLDAARDRLDEQFAALEDLRRNEDRLKKKDLMDARLGIKSAVLENTQEATKAVMDMYGVNAKVASQLVDAAVRQAGQRAEAIARERTAHISGGYGVQQAQIHANAQLGAAGMYASENAKRTRMEGLKSLIKDDNKNNPDSFQGAMQIRRMALAEVKADPQTKMMNIMEDSPQFEDLVRRKEDEIRARLGGSMSQSASSAAPVVPPVKIIGVRPGP